MAEKIFKRTTVTAALIYANGPIHIGHLAGCYLPSDIFVRYLRSKGEDVIFVSGTDEHGVPITLKARNENTTPQAIVDKYYEMIRKSFADFGISFDTYSRTSRPIHHETSQDFFTRLYEKGIFEEKTTEQYFDPVAGQFLADRYIVGTCPTCGNENAYGDQCERCGSTLSPQELGNPRSMLSGEKPVLKPTTNWYMPLDKLQPKIEEYIDSHTEWKPNVFGQCKSWLNQGLQPRSMTRDLEWGVKVPLPDTEGKVLYVWFDAPIGYISATKELRPKDWELYWKDEGSRLVHFIGKDNIVFHCIIFPSMLMEHGEFVVPDNVPANEFMNLEGQKISTSRNWAVWLHEYLEEFPGKQDVLRYALCANAPEAKDNDFTWKDFQTRNNSELVAIFGNFVNRAMVLTHKYFEGLVPERGEVFSYDDEVLKKLAAFPGIIGTSIEQFRFREALASLMDLARLGNKYLADTEPWKLIKSDPERVKTIMNIALQIAATLQVACEPFLPFTAEKLKAMLGMKTVKWKDLGAETLLAGGHKLNEPGLLFEKMDDEIVDAQIIKLENTKKANSPSPVPDPVAQTIENVDSELPAIKSSVVYDDFAKLDIRVATVVECERVPKSDKLLKFLLDTGVDRRTVLSGIAKYYQPEELIGRQVILLANLAPRKIMGIESQGMILSAEQPNGGLTLLQPKTEVAAGATVG